MYELLSQLDNNFFSFWQKDLFKNANQLDDAQFLAVSSNNWNVIFKAFKAYVEKENFQDSYIEDINIDYIISGDRKEYFGFFLILISIIVMKKRYFWNQSLGKIHNSNSYNFLKNLEKTLNISEEVPEASHHKLVEADRDESQTLIDMITDLERKLRSKTDEASRLRLELEQRLEEIDEVKKLHEQKTFDTEKMRIRLEALELSQKEYYDAMAIQKDCNLLAEKVKKLEKREEDLEMDNSFLRDRINEHDKKIKELKEIESKYNVDENMRKKFEMVLERNETMNTESRKKELEIEGLKYQVELLKKNKDAIENALITSKNEKLKLDQEINVLHEDLKAREQELSNTEKLMIKFRDAREIDLLSSQNTIMSPSNKMKSKIVFTRTYGS